MRDALVMVVMLVAFLSIWYAMDMVTLKNKGRLMFQTTQEEREYKARK